MTVTRQGRAERIPAEDLVPGDVLLIGEGNRIPADARLVRSDDLVVNNAPLTGEAKPQALQAGASGRRLSESDNIAFAGCSVLRSDPESARCRAVL